MEPDVWHPREEHPDRDSEHSDDGSEQLDRGNPPAPEAPPDTSEHPSHEEAVGGKGAEDPAELADEERFRKGPGW